MNTVTKPSPLQDRSIRISALVCGLGFLGFLVWGMIAKLDEGVTASGTIVVQENRKAVQHFEGGIIRSLNVHEGQFVEEGAILMELEPVQSETARDELAQEYAAQTANLERLLALRAGQETLEFKTFLTIDVDEVTRSEIMAHQLSLFDEVRGTHAAELSVLRTRRQSLEGRRRDLENQISATRRALENAREDLQLRQQLLDEKLETIGNVSQIQREVARYETDLSRLIGDRNEARSNAEEVEEQIAESEARYQEGLGEQLVETQSSVLTTRERLLALDDRLARTTIRAPQSGNVLNLAHTTIGGVVGPGELIMEIVPDTGDLIATVRLSPTDRDAVAPGQIVEAQMTAYKQFLVPRMSGEVLGVSADLKQDEVTGVYYYEARVSLDASSLDENSRVQIIPGMPVDAFIASGNRRTFLDYVFEPIRATFTRGTRMS